MHLIRLTKKTQKYIGLPPKEIMDVSIESLMGEWYCSNVEILGGECLLFLNGKTRINFIVPDYPPKSLQIFTQTFKTNLSSLLSFMGITDSAKSMIMQEANEVSFANTDSRKIMGNLNQLSWQYQVLIGRAESLHSPEIPQIILTCNKGVMKGISTTPIEELKSLVCQSTI